MCDFGISAIVASVVATVVSTTLGVVSSVQSTNAAESQADYQAAVARENAKTAEQNAANTRQEGIEEARLQRMKTLQNIGSQQATMAANGIDISNGTALDVIQDTATMGELDALTIRYNAESKALAYEQSAGNYNNQANLDILSGQNAANANRLNGIANAANGLGNSLSVASNWYSPKSSKKTGTKISGGFGGGGDMLA